MQMIDLMLQDARIPARRLDDLGISFVIQTVDPHLARPLHHGRKPGQAQAAPSVHSVWKTAILFTLVTTVLFGIVPAPLLDLANHASLIFVSH